MDRNELRELWIDADPPLPCRMADGKIALLIRGPTDSQVARNDWRFGFQVPREEDIRWLLPEQIKREGRGLAEA